MTHLLRLERLRRPLPLQVLAPQDFVNLIEGLCPFPYQPVAQLRQVPVLLFLLAGKMDPAYSLHAITSQQTLPINPQQLAQRVRITAIRLPLGPLHRLDDHHVLTRSVRLKTFDQPIMKSTYLDDRHKSPPIIRTQLMHLPQELLNLFQASADLPSHEHIPSLVTERNGHLLAMEIDSKVQHNRFSWLARLPERVDKHLGEPHGYAVPFQENLSCPSFIESLQPVTNRFRTSSQREMP